MSKPKKSISFVLALAAIAAPAPVAAQGGPGHVSAKVIYHLPELAHHLPRGIHLGHGFVDQSVSRLNYDSSGNAWLPKFVCTANDTMSGVSNFTIYEYRAKGSEKNQIVINGTLLGEKINAFAPASNATSPIKLPQGTLQVDVTQKLHKDSPVLGGTINFAGRSLTNAEAGEIFDAEKGNGDNFKGNFEISPGVHTSFTCSEQIPYLRVKFDEGHASSSAKTKPRLKSSNLPEVVVTAKAKPGKKANDDVACLTPGVGKELDLFAELVAESEAREAYHQDDRLKKVLVLTKRPLREFTRDEIILITKQSRGKKMPKVLVPSEHMKMSREMHFPDEHFSGFIEKIASDEQFSDPKQAVNLVNEAFERGDNVGIKILNNIPNRVIQTQIRYIVSLNNKLDYTSYSEKIKEMGYPVLSEKAFNAISKIAARAEQIQLEQMKSRTDSSGQNKTPAPEPAPPVNNDENGSDS